MIEKTLHACVVTFMVGVLFILLCLISYIACEYAASYTATYDTLIDAKEIRSSQEYSAKLLVIVEEVIAEKKLVEVELEAAKTMILDLQGRVEAKENAIADSCQAAQDMAMTNRNLLFRLQDIQSLLMWTIDNLPDEQKALARSHYNKIMNMGINP